MRAKRYDLIVIGGGPAGSTLATLVKQQNPSARVLIVEKSAFPRHHIGESLLIGANPVLREMGAYEKIDSAGFPKKVGATMVWGKDRKPWDINFNCLDEDLPPAERSGLAESEHSWQALRSKYDQILLEHARSVGVEARLETSAVEPVLAGGRITGLVVEGKDGRERLESRMVADCSGQQGFLQRFCKTRAFREDLRNVAAYAYYRNAPWKFKYQGDPDRTKIFVCSTPHGWFWYIPVARDTVSVGLVSKLSYIKAAGVKDMRKHFFDAVEACPEIRGLLAKAELAKGIDPQDPEKEFFTIGDFSYKNERACGEGWIAAGDSAFFIDPILSTGVALAHLSGHRAAYSITTAWRAKDARAAQTVWRDYDRFCKELGGGILALVHFWYAHDPDARSWWTVGKKELRRLSPFDVADKVSFVAIASGLSCFLERAYLRPTPTLFEAPMEWHGWLWKGTMYGIDRWDVPDVWLRIPPYLINRVEKEDARVRRMKRAVALENVTGELVPRWTRKWRLETTFVPDSRSGQLKPVERLVFSTSADAIKGSADFKRMMPASYVALAKLIDGKRSVSELVAAAIASSALPRDVVEARVFRLLKDMLVLETIAVSKPRGRRRTASVAVSRAMSLLREGEQALLRQGDASRAEPLLGEAIARGLEEPWAYALRGEARRHLGRVEHALRDLSRALELLRQARCDLSSMPLREALAAFDRELSAREMEDKVRLFRAKAFEAAGDVKAALADVAAALDVNPKHSEALLLQAKLMRKAGDLGGARETLKAALAAQRPARR